jgi:glycine cleavage system aminomethyltransferase T
MLDQGIGLAYVEAGLAAPDTQVTLDLRGRSRAAHIVKKPIYDPKES